MWELTHLFILVSFIMVKNQKPLTYLITDVNSTFDNCQCGYQKLMISTIWKTVWKFMNGKSRISIWVHIIRAMYIYLHTKKWRGVLYYMYWFAEEMYNGLSCAWLCSSCCMGSGGSDIISFLIELTVQQRIIFQTFIAYLLFTLKVKMLNILSHAFLDPQSCSPTSSLS